MGTTPRKFKLFGDDKKEIEVDEDENADLEQKEKANVNEKLQQRLNRISESKLAAMRKVHSSYASWLSENESALMDSAQIDAKQSEMESELGENVNAILTESYDIARALSVGSLQP